MSDDSKISYSFLPWVRWGAAKGIKSAFLGKSMTAVPGRAGIEMELRLTGEPGGSISTIPIPLKLYGPGDVIGIDVREIVRTEPRPLATDFPCNFFPLVEFDRPDFPWLFTPGAPDSEDCLRPWIVLVVVSKSAETSFSPGRPLPVLQCPVTELPDLNDSWAWAHAQYIGTGPLPEDGGQPDLNVSRLICTRRLVENQSYYACLVPAFEVGRKVGLGIVPSKDENITPAWNRGMPSIVELPVYYHWEFRTVREEIFRDLAERLKPGTPGSLRRMDIGRPGFGMGHYDGATLGIEGAMQEPGIKPEYLPQNFQKDLRVLLGLPSSDSSVQPPPVGATLPPGPGRPPPVGATLPPGPGRPPPVGATLPPGPGRPPPVGATLPPGPGRPPFGGTTHPPGPGGGPPYGGAVPPSPGGGIPSLPPSDGNTLSPPGGTENEVTRIPLPLYGDWYAEKTNVSRVDGPAWLLELNLDPRYRMAAALGTQVVQRRQEELVAAAWEQAAELTAVNQLLRQMQLGRAVTASIYERLSSLGALSAEAFLQTTAPCRPVPPISSSGGAYKILAAGFTPPPAPESQLRGAVFSSSFRRMTRPLSPIARKKKPTIPAENTPINKIVHPNWTGQSVRSQIDVLTSVVPPLGATAGAIAVSGYPRDVVAPPVPALEKDRLHAMAQLEPEANFREEVTERIEVPKGMEHIWERSDPLQPINFAPTFNQPMYEALLDLFRDRLIPGLGHVDNNSVVMLSPNAKFIESYMVGLNHELSRELLWREYPTDLTSTYFRQFWGVGGSQPNDFRPIATWNAPLGKNMLPERSTNLKMLLIRSDLLVRYPNAIIYARISSGSNAEDYRFPVIHIDPGQGMTVVGFDLQGWKWESGEWDFVIEEHPAATRFGFRGNSDSTTNLPPEKPIVAWGTNSAWIASNTLQRPYRLVIPARNWGC